MPPAFHAGNAMTEPVNIVLNGQSHRLEGEPTLAGLLAEAGLAGRRVAVEVNREIVPRGRHAEHRLRDGDRVEIVQALGGG
jgi:sulfur carrier protein